MVVCFRASLQASHLRSPQREKVCVRVGIAFLANLQNRALRNEDPIHTDTAVRVVDAGAAPSLQSVQVGVDTSSSTGRDACLVTLAARAVLVRNWGVGVVVDTRNCKRTSEEGGVRNMWLIRRAYMI